MIWDDPGQGIQRERWCKMSLQGTNVASLFMNVGGFSSFHKVVSCHQFLSFFAVAAAKFQKSMAVRLKKEL